MSTVETVSKREYSPSGAYYAGWPLSEAGCQNKGDRPRMRKAGESPFQDMILGEEQKKVIGESAEARQENCIGEGDGTEQEVCNST